MKQTRLANRYAKALFELALEQQKLEILAEDFQMLNMLIAQNRELNLMLKSPIIKEKKKIAVFKAIFAGKIDELSLRFIILLAKNRREDLIQQVSESLITIYDEYRGIVKAWVSSAEKLDEDARKAILELLKNKSGKEIDLHENINADLLGGFIIKLDDYQYDASTKTLLKKFKDNIKNNLVFAGK